MTKISEGRDRYQAYMEIMEKKLISTNKGLSVEPID